MTCHPAMTTITVINAVNTTNHIEMPSTPRWYVMLKRSIQVAFSTNCRSAVLESKLVNSGIVTIKLRTEPISASQRAGPGFLSEPIARTRRPNRIGNQIAILKIGYVCIVWCPLALFAA
jgi:hypothetical protein